MPLPSPAVAHASPGRMKWRLAVGAIVALVVGTLWRTDEVPVSPGPMPVNLTGSAPLTFAPPAAGQASESPEMADLRQALDRAGLGDAPALTPLGVVSGQEAQEGRKASAPQGRRHLIGR